MVRKDRNARAGFGSIRAKIATVRDGFYPKGWCAKSGFFDVRSEPRTGVPPMAKAASTESAHRRHGSLGLDRHRAEPLRVAKEKLPYRGQFNASTQAMK